MRSTVLNRVCIAFTMVWVANGAAAVSREPTRLVDPTFQIPYDRRAVEFEPMPLATMQLCQQTDPSTVTPVFYIYGRAVDEHGRIFYATGGYEVRLAPNKPTFRKYHVGGLGTVFFVEGDRCQQIGPIMDTFTAGEYEETTTTVLSSLANDMAARYEKAFSGQKALREAFRKYRVKRNPYAPELDKAFERYFVK